MSEISEPLLVRNGENASLGYDRDGNPLHTRLNVMRVMIWEICLNYPGIPDVRTMDMDEIEFFYEGLRPTLRAMTKNGE